MCINDLLTGICTQAANVIKSTPLYRHKVKQLTNALIKSRQKYDLSTMALFKRDGITVLDFFDAQNDELAQDVEMLRLQIKQDIDRVNAPYSNELSYLMLAEVMGHYAAGFFDMTVRTLRTKAAILMSDKYSPHEVWHSITALIKAVGDALKINALKIEMNENVLAVFDRLTTKLQDMKRANNNLLNIYNEQNSDEENGNKEDYRRNEASGYQDARGMGERKDGQPPRPDTPRIRETRRRFELAAMQQGDARQ